MCYSDIHEEWVIFIRVGALKILGWRYMGWVEAYG